MSALVRSVTLPVVRVLLVLLLLQLVVRPLEVGERVVDVGAALRLSVVVRHVVRDPLVRGVLFPSCRQNGT